MKTIRLAIFLSAFLVIFFGLENNASAKDLYISTTGNDSVAYVNNSISLPWLTVDKVLKNALAGDNVYFRAGTYVISTEIYNAGAADGTVANPITYSNYQDETVTISGSCSGKNLIQLETDNYHFEDLNFACVNNTSGTSIFFLAENNTALNFWATRCTFLISSSDSTDNTAAITLNQTRSNGARIEYCTFTGDYPVSTSNAVIIFRTADYQINNCHISNFQNGIFMKHSNSLTTGVEFKNNFITDCQQGIQTVSNYALIANNILVNTYIRMGIDGGVGDGYVGADYNNLNHNTIYGGNIQMIYETRATDPNKWCTHNTISDNIFTTKSLWHEYITAGPYYNTGDYNLFIAGNAINEGGVDYTVSAWSAHNTSDVNSLSGSPTFISGSPASIADYALSATSLGYGTGSAGSNMGADVSLVGIQEEISGDTIAPGSPSGLFVT